MHGTTVKIKKKCLDPTKIRDQDRPVRSPVLIRTVLFKGSLHKLRVFETVSQG